MVEKIAGTFSREKKRVSILSRGYGRSSCREISVVSDGSRLLARFPESGDEAYLLARNLPSVSVVVGKDRLRTGSLAIDSMKAEMIILDDGFQYLPLKRNLDLVLLDASDPFGHGHLFPRGLLREPIEQLSRADLFVIVKGREDEDLGGIIESLGRLNSRASVFVGMRCPLFLVRMPEESREELEGIRGKKSIALSGIANPASFLSVLEQLGAEVIHSFSFPDHHPYSPGELERILNWGWQAGAEVLVTTQKDAVRIPSDFFPCPIPLIYPRIEIRISQEEEFLSLLRRSVIPS
jgi:tetraacyldisaccharide 4'-kinase